MMLHALLVYKKSSCQLVAKDRVLSTGILAQDQSDSKPRLYFRYSS